MSKKIFIDAGHGGNDPGAVNGARQEKNDNLRFSLALGKRLQENGFQVLQSRTTDTALSLNDRSRVANNWKADLAIIVHRNSFSNASANGQEVWTYTKVDQKTKNFANAIYNEIVSVYAQSKRGVKQGDLHMVRETSMPAVLLEIGFISNTLDNQKYDEFFNQYVKAVTKAIFKEFDVAYNAENSLPAPQPTGQLFKVQIGAFSNRANAENILQKAKNSGFVDSYITQS